MKRIELWILLCALLWLDATIVYYRVFTWVCVANYDQHGKVYFTHPTATFAPMDLPLVLIHVPVIIGLIKTHRSN